jgi:hypothetical protein
MVQQAQRDPVVPSASAKTTLEKRGYQETFEMGREREFENRPPKQFLDDLRALRSRVECLVDDVTGH